MSNQNIPKRGVKEIGIVSHIQVVLENGQRVIRDRALFGVKLGKMFVDSISAEKIKILLHRDETLEIKNQDFVIYVQTKDVEIPSNFMMKIGEVIFEVEKVNSMELSVKRIVKGGFVKAGNKVMIVKF